MMIDRLVIIGVGLIGGSLAKALREAHAVGEIIGCGRDPDQLQLAVDLGVIDRFDSHVSSAVKSADVVVVATPVGSMQEIFAQMRGQLAPQTIVTDVGSTKQSVIDAMLHGYGSLPPMFVPGHPIAGTEKSGVAAAFSGLFHNRKVILTPLPQTDLAAVARVGEMWELCGARVNQLSVSHHDHILALTSHLPHMLAFSLVDTLAKLNDSAQMFQLVAGGFRDFTRIASSDPQMWHDICLNNRSEILAALTNYRQGLDLLAKAISENDSDALLEIFTRAKQARDKFIQ